VTDGLLLLVAKLSLATATSPSPSPTSSTFSPNVVSSRATDDNIVRPGWLGFLVFLAMAGAVYLLARSFLKQMKRINFDEGPDPAALPSTSSEVTRPSGSPGATNAPS
jgi:hypothetical protein